MFFALNSQVWQWLGVALAVPPLVDLLLLVKIGSALGFWLTMSWLLLSAMIGFNLLRRQGGKILSAIREDLLAGRSPEDRLLSGVLLLLGAYYLIMPGLLTDLLGLLLIIPGNRRLLTPRLETWLCRQGGLLKQETPSVNSSFSNRDIE